MHLPTLTARHHAQPPSSASSPNALTAVYPRSMTVVVRLRRALRHSTTCARQSRPASTTTTSNTAALCRYLVLPLLLLVLTCSLLYYPSGSIPQTTLASIIRTAHIYHPENHAASNSVLLPPPADHPNAAGYPVLPGNVGAPLARSASDPILSHVDAIVGKGRSAKKVLVDVYAIPSIIVANMTQHVATRLYWKLVYTDIVRALSLHPTQMEASSPSSSSTSSSSSSSTTSSSTDHQILQSRATVFFVHAQNGLGNRLRAIASGIALAKATHRVPVIVWQSDAHMMAKLSDIMVVHHPGSDINNVLYRDLVVMEDFPTWTEVNSRTMHWQPFNYMQKDRNGAMTMEVMRFEPPNNSTSLSEPPSGVEPIAAIHAVLNSPPQPARPAFDASLIRPHQHVYFKTAYVANSLPLTLNNNHNVNYELRALTPIPKIMTIVDRFDQHRLRFSYGIHIRSRSIAEENLHVDISCEYTKVGAWTTDYWRSRSQLPVFVQKINQKLRLRKNATFFVASDDRAGIKKLKELYPGRIDSIDRDCDDREASCVMYAMADLLCLARTRRLYGSNWSSFSEVAGRLTNRRLYLSGKDFGRPKRRWIVHRIKMIPTTAWKFWLSLGNQYTSCHNTHSTSSDNNQVSSNR